MEIGLILSLVLFIAPLSTIVHELGHAIGAKFFHADSIILSIGIGKEILCLTGKKVQLSVHSLFFLGGLASNERGEAYKPLEIICITLCGPITNGILAITGYFLFGFSNDYIQLFILFNCWLAFVNLIPFKLNGKYSDGFTIFKTITKAHTSYK